MKILYIDANIYLGFYNSNKPEFKKLLRSIIELGDKIFFTEQIASEIDRNKLSIFCQSIDNSLKQISLMNTLLPEHLDEETSPKLTEWNETRKKLENEVSESNIKLVPIIKDLINDISQSKDKVSKGLSSLYKKAKKPTKNDLEKARLRKELGNPPGKRVDPLGDQLSWEQLLRQIPKIEKLWIVSSDRDYFSEQKNDLYLNPILYKDLKNKNSKLDIKIFRTLSEALRDFNSQEKIKSLPDTKDLDSISKTESLDLSIPFNMAIHNTNHFLACPNCGSINTSIDYGFFILTTGGRLTYSYVCNSCKNTFQVE